MFEQSNLDQINEWPSPLITGGRPNVFNLRDGEQVAAAFTVFSVTSPVANPQSASDNFAGSFSVFSVTGVEANRVGLIGMESSPANFLLRETGDPDDGFLLEEFADYVGAAFNCFSLSSPPRIQVDPDADRFAGSFLPFTLVSPIRISLPVQTENFGGSFVAYSVTSP